MPESEADFVEAAYDSMLQAGKAVPMAGSAADFLIEYQAVVKAELSRQLAAAAERATRAAADDAEPVTEEFLESMGFKQEDHPVKWTLHRDDALPIGTWNVSDGWKAVLIYHAHGSMDLVRQQNTRGHVRRLLATLAAPATPTGG